MDRTVRLDWRRRPLTTPPLLFLFRYPTLWRRMMKRWPPTLARSWPSGQCPVVPREVLTFIIQSLYFVLFFFRPSPLTALVLWKFSTIAAYHWTIPLFLNTVHSYDSIVLTITRAWVGNVVLETCCKRYILPHLIIFFFRIPVLNYSTLLKNKIKNIIYLVTIVWYI